MSSIGQNFSLQLSRQLSNTQTAIARALERLSSGKRINSPADDMAGYSLVQDLDSQIRGLSQANLNINQARGLLETADSAISSQIDIVQRMRELAVQGANDLLSSSDRSSINQELFSLRDEFNRITQSTVFGELDLLKGESRDIAVDGQGNQLTIDDPDIDLTDVFSKGVGSTTFTNTFTVSVDDNSTYIQMADVNNDGVDDLVSLDSTGDAINVNLGNGDGSFGQVISTSISGNNIIQVSDFNGDGLLDVASANPTDDTIGVSYGNGDGSFQARVSIYQGTTLGDIRLGDVNGNGNLDILAEDGNEIAIVLSNGDGSFEDNGLFFASTGSLEFEVGDFDNDGFADVVRTNTSSNTVRVEFGDADGHLSGEVSYGGVGDTPRDIAVGDLNNDGIDDFILEDNDTDELYAFLSDGDRTFTALAGIANGIGNSPLLTDVNGDGNLDLNFNTSFWFGTGYGTFQANSLTLERSISFAGDINGDGIVDLAVGDGANDVIIVLPQGVNLVGAVGDINVNSSESANELIEILDRSLDFLTSARADLAVAQSRLEFTSDSNLLQQESLTAAKDEIESADFAIETANLVTAQIQQQAQIAALSQANSQLQIVLGLLPNL